MSHQLIMNVTLGETRIARLEDNAVAELYIEREGDQQVTGNIYKGLVTRVLPGMQAAFVDIGLEKAAFLYVSDILPDMDEGDDDEEEEATPNAPSDETQGPPEPKPAPAPRGRRRRQRGPLPKIETLLKEGQTIMVQVAKDPIRTKGARVTGQISFPGRYVVFMPTVDHVGVSRKVGSYEERQRLKKIIVENRPPKSGFIARTVSQGATEENLINDMKNLQSIWEGMRQKIDKTKAPGLLYQDLSLVLRSVRDLMSDEIDRLVIDSEEDYREILRFMEKFMPDLANRVELYTKDVPLFDLYGIETEINRALGKKVWLKSGGYLIIDQNEALTSIDVNTGRFVGRDDFEETILQNNLEAAREIAYQLKLRNIGGIIINDFIDMERFGNRQRVFYALKDALREDRVKTTITKISELGLVEMTRKRTRDSLTETLTEQCPVCVGKGRVKTPLTIAFEIFREVRRTFKQLEGKTIVIRVHPRVSQAIFNEARARLELMERRIGKRVVIETSESLHVEKFEISAR